MGRIAGLGTVLICVGMAGTARAITLEAGVDAFAAATVSCGAILGPTPQADAASDGAAGPAGADSGPTTAKTSAGTSKVIESDTNCPQGNDLFDGLTVAGSTQTVSTLLSPHATAGFEPKDRKAGDVSVSVSYDASLFAPLSGTSGGKAFAAGTTAFGSAGGGGFRALGSGAFGSENPLGEFRNVVTLDDIVPVADLPGAYAVNTSLVGGASIGPPERLPAAYTAKTPVRKNAKKKADAPATLSPTVFWMLVLGVPAAIAAVFALFGLVGMIINVARRRAGVG